MVKLEALKAGISLSGIEPALIATVVAVVPIGDGAVQVLYKTPEGTIKERLLSRPDEANINLATVERPWAFDGNGRTSSSPSRPNVLTSLSCLIP